jgi:hypothetical protein
MNRLTEYKLIPANDGIKQLVVALVQENNLPISDLDKDKHLFALLHKDEIIGTGGLEFF